MKTTSQKQLLKDAFSFSFKGTVSCTGQRDFIALSAATTRWQKKCCQKNVVVLTVTLV